MSALGYKDGWDAAQEDYAIGAHFDVPSETLSIEYRKGYVESWQQCQRASTSFGFATDGDEEFYDYTTDSPSGFNLGDIV